MVACLIHLIHLSAWLNNTVLLNLTTLRDQFQTFFFSKYLLIVLMQYPLQRTRNCIPLVLINVRNSVHSWIRYLREKGVASNGRNVFRLIEIEYRFKTFILFKPAFWTKINRWTLALYQNQINPDRIYTKFEKHSSPKHNKSKH